MAARRMKSKTTGHQGIALLLTLVIVLPCTIASLWVAKGIYFSLYPFDPEAEPSMFPEGLTMFALLFAAVIVGGIVGGFLWAIAAKPFMTKEEVYKWAFYGVRIPFVSGLNKAFLRWLYRG